MKKIRSLNEIEKIVKRFRKEGKTIGLITGCFDVVHIGHLELFRFAKKHVDIVVVGVDGDESIKKTKGKDRPLNSLRARLKFLSDIQNVDYTFPIEEVYAFDSDEAVSVHIEILRRIEPNYLITNKARDCYWRKKKARAKKNNVKFLLDMTPRINSSNRIIKKLGL